MLLAGPQAFSKNSTDAVPEENASTAPAAGKRALPAVPMQRMAMNGGGGGSGGPQKSVLERLEELTKVKSLLSYASLHAHLRVALEGLFL